MNKTYLWYKKKGEGEWNIETEFMPEDRFPKSALAHLAIDEAIETL